MSATSSQQQPQAEYNLPGVLHFLQIEWRRYERDRNEWEIERAEMKARIALLEGERRGIENVKTDLMRRVKMLEIALRQERSKYLASNPKEQTATKEQPPAKQSASSMPNGTKPHPSTGAQLPANLLAGRPSSLARDPAARKQSREFLQQCLREVTYLTNTTAANTLSTTRVMRSEPPSYEPPVGRVPKQHRDSIVYLGSDNPPLGSRSMQRPNSQSNASTPMHEDQELPNGSVQADSRYDFEDGEGSGTAIFRPKDKQQWQEQLRKGQASELRSIDEVQLTKDAQQKFNLTDEKVSKLMKNAKRKASQIVTAISTPDDELANLTVDEVDASTDSNLDYKLWKPRYTLNSHLDAVRSLSFHRHDLSVLSGSEDGTMRYWNSKSLNKRNGNASQDLEPQTVFRGHVGAVSSVAIATEQNMAYSGGLDATIRSWSLPTADQDAYASVDNEKSVNTLVGHTDAVWDLRLFPMRSADTQLLASASADGTVKIWDTESSTGSHLKTSWSYGGAQDEDSASMSHTEIPTSLDFVPSDLKKLAVSFNNSVIRLYDVETGQVIITLTSDETSDGTPLTQINRIISHPTMPLIFSAHEDRYVRFFDIHSGQCVQSMTAHLDAVTSLDVDAAGLSLVSGGHDCSVRFWDLRSLGGGDAKSAIVNCVQEFTSHRRKSDEGVLDVKYHSSLPYVASAGADGVVKVYA